MQVADGRGKVATTQCRISVQRNLFSPQFINFEPGLTIYRTNINFNQALNTDFFFPEAVDNDLTVSSSWKVMEDNTIPSIALQLTIVFNSVQENNFFQCISYKTSFMATLYKNNYIVHVFKDLL